MMPADICVAVFAALVVLGVALAIALIASVVGAVREWRAREERMARRQVALDAEAQLRDSTQATMRAMRETIRRHGGQA